MQLWDVPPEKLQAPVVQRTDFESVMKHSFSTVSEDELKRFVGKYSHSTIGTYVLTLALTISTIIALMFLEWTKLFGQDGA